MNIQTALLATLSFFICNGIDRVMGWQVFERPIIAGAVTGIILGDIKTGVIMGASLEAIFMGMSPIGGSLPSDPFPTAVVCVAYTVITKSPVEVAIGLSIPIGTIMQTVKELYKPVLASAAQFWERLAASGDFKKFRRLSILQAVFIDRLPIFFVLFLSIAFGATSLSSVFDALPTWFMNGLMAGSSMMTAIGFAILTSMIWNKNIGIFLLFGFVLAKYLELSALPIAIIAATFAFLYYFVMEYIVTTNNQQPSVSTQSASQADEEDFF